MKRGFLYGVAAYLGFLALAGFANAFGAGNYKMLQGDFKTTTMSLVFALISVGSVRVARSVPRTTWFKQATGFFGAYAVGYVVLFVVAVIIVRSFALTTPTSRIWLIWPFHPSHVPPQYQLVGDPPVAEDQSESDFVASGNTIANSNNALLSVRIAERIPISQLKKRFAGFRVNSTAGEDCLVCATIVQGPLSITVDYDEDGIVVTGITCEGRNCVDSLGNRVGDSLRQAAGSKAACDAGDFTTCASYRLDGLHYIVKEDPKCRFSIQDNAKDTNIPVCATIDGLQILPKSTSH
jgi:hypothetical protein